MTPKRALQAIAIVSLIGVLFSGALTYREFVGGAAACSALGATGTILGYPPCVYGLVMYTAVFALSLLGLRKPPASGPETPSS
jgi:uncharacterized membrane protein